LDTYDLSFEPGWDRLFVKMDKTVQIRVYKKILQLKTGVQGRHLEHGVSFFVKEVAGWRIVYSSDEPSRMRKIYFVGSHKDYETWHHSK
jgi:hypothetical protein